MNSQSQTDRPSLRGCESGIATTAAAWRSLRERLARFLRAFAAERRARRAIRELQAMSDVELRDLSVHRSDIGRVVLRGRVDHAPTWPARTAKK